MDAFINIEQGSAHWVWKGPESNISGFVNCLCHHSSVLWLYWDGSHRQSVSTNAHGCVPIKLYLQKRWSTHFGPWAEICWVNLREAFIASVEGIGQNVRSQEKSGSWVSQVATERGGFYYGLNSSQQARRADFFFLSSFLLLFLISEVI